MICKKNKVVLTATVKYHLPVTALFNCVVCLAMQRPEVANYSDDPAANKTSNWDEVLRWLEDWKFCASAWVRSWSEYCNCWLHYFWVARTAAAWESFPPLANKLSKTLCLCRAIEQIIDTTTTVLNLVKGLCWFFKPCGVVPAEKLIRLNVLR